jgi:hypothetical protein
MAAPMEKKTCKEKIEKETNSLLLSCKELQKSIDCKHIFTWTSASHEYTEMAS